ncbi:diacylglycerol/lipid kinase family protein [Arcanobacterium buesumense]|uniref:Diacylglycerol kinase n=1 Tax=Arcanobacterium buesumense TaxID=2722751 RepID=A0A6H2ENA1_9ACTO|nr:diacylglycerol kinase family protein [Arcanobacterium buesumense]QJC22558.1 diacylglycerol kinase [Arcanobacterium buesumense]
MDWDLILWVATFIIAVVALLGMLRNRRTIRTMMIERRRTTTMRDTETNPHTSTTRQGPPYVIYNPTKKANWEEIREAIARTAHDASLGEPIWLETTAEDPGVSQTQAAIDAQAAVIIAAGGDGTVRVVAEGLTNTNIPLGLIPVGTGNVLARNLNLPLDDVRELAVIALTGINRKIDVGVLEVKKAHAPSPQSTKHEDLKSATIGRYVFVVNAGMGLDAAIMAEADANKKLKEIIGWPAYFKAAMPHILAPKMTATISVGSATTPVTTDARTVMFLNCGELVGGLVFDSTSKTDDGWMELAVVDTRAGIIGWVDLLRRTGLRGMGIKKVDIPGVPAQGDLDIHRIREATLETEQSHPVQVDGDVLGYANHIRARIVPNALNVRVRN